MLSSQTGTHPANIEVIRTAWQNLVESSRIDKRSLRDEIALSWERCLRRNLCPHGGNYPMKPADSFSDRDLFLQIISKPHMQGIYDHLKSQGFVVILTGAHGEILRIIGDRKMQGVAEGLAVVPGGSFHENVLGTTSPGICIEKKIPIQVLMYEHYCQLFHSWCCTAAPIFDQSGNFIGSLDVSNLDKSRHHPYLLDFVRMTARTIGLEFSYRMLQRDFARTYHYDQSGNASYGFCFETAAPGCGAAFRNPVGEEIIDIPQDDVTHLPFRRRIDRGGSLRGSGQPKPSRAAAPCTPGSGENGHLRYSFDSFIHKSAAVREVVQEARRLAGRDINVFISGESGTGKEILAQAIHNASPRRDRPFVAVNCAGLPKELIQSELFGYVEGAFTGARRKGQPGKFEQAHGGTLFLDEVGDMPLDAQANLLRVLQEKYVVRLGGNQPVPVDVRVISATNKDLAVEIEEGRFRADLYYRLVVIDLAIPPLRERGSDLWLLMDAFIRKFAGQHDGCRNLTFSDAARRILENYSWPGNVRELENAVLSIMAKTRDGLVEPRHLPRIMARAAEGGANFTPDQAPPRFESPQACPLPGSLNATSKQEAHEQMLLGALNATGYNISKAAKLLGVSRATMYRRMKNAALPVDREDKPADS